MLSVVLCFGLASAFVSQPQLSRAAVDSSSSVVMIGRKPLRPAGYEPKVARTARPLSPGSNYPTTKNIQRQRNGFGTFRQAFQKSSTVGSKYGVPIFLKNGNVNPAYLAAERRDMQQQSKLNMKATEAKRKKLISKGSFELAGYIRKAIGEVGSGKEYYQSGK